MSENLIKIAGDNIRCVIDLENGGRLASLIAFDRELLVTKDAKFNIQQWGSYPMVPYAGRVRRGKFIFDSKAHELEISLAPHAIHGTVLDRAFSVIDSSHQSVTMKIDLGERFGFAGSVQQTISINKDTIDFVLTLSTDAERMPGQVGWHPWFARPCRIETDFAQMCVRDSDGIPSGEVVSPPAGPYDDCFTGARKSPRIIFDESITVQIDSDCSHWVVYDQPEHAICVEPQSGPPDGFNLAPLVITRDKPLSRFMRFTVTK